MRGLLIPAFAARLDRHERTSVGRRFALSNSGLNERLLERRVEQNGNYQLRGGRILLSRSSGVNIRIGMDSATVIKL